MVLAPASGCRVQADPPAAAPAAVPPGGNPDRPCAGERVPAALPSDAFFSCCLAVPHGVTGGPFGSRHRTFAHHGVPEMERHHPADPSVALPPALSCCRNPAGLSIPVVSPSLPRAGDCSGGGVTGAPQLTVGRPGPDARLEQPMATGAKAELAVEPAALDSLAPSTRLALSVPRSVPRRPSWLGAAAPVALPGPPRHPPRRRDPTLGLGGAGSAHPQSGPARFP